MEEPNPLFSPSGLPTDNPLLHATLASSEAGFGESPSSKPVKANLQRGERLRRTDPPCRHPGPDRVAAYQIGLEMRTANRLAHNEARLSKQ
eukprot:3744849-Pyramimonas_sp.AAC.1